MSPLVAIAIRRRLVLPLIAFLLLSSLDRVNISFAALAMNRELGLTASQYGFGAGILFAGFLLGQYPSVLLLQRVGMRRWLSGCAILWSLGAAGVAFARTPPEFYLLRVIVGLAESGLAPGIVLYLSQFATDRQRARTFGLPMVAIPISVVIGSPLSAWLMTSGAPASMAPWRAMLIAEALPALLLGIAARFYFPDTPHDAGWLSQQEIAELEAVAASNLRTRVENDWRVLRAPLVWIAAVLWFCLLSGSYGLIFWLPQVSKSLSGLSTQAIGWVNALPWLGAAIGMGWNAAHSDRTGERIGHVALPAAFAAVAVLLAWQFNSGSAALCALLVLGSGLGAAQGAFWALPTALLTPRTLAVAAVAINLLGSAGGLVVPHLIGYTLDAGGGYGGVSLLIAGTLMLACVLTLGMRLWPMRYAVQEPDQCRSPGS
jgi:ACS family tartrate transporter-like MFS transporter